MWCVVSDSWLAAASLVEWLANTTTHHNPRILRFVQEKYLVGVDTGGTFTDLVVVSPEGAVYTHKVLSTPHDPAEAVVAGVRALCGDAPRRLVHGSTVATNALLERQGARTVLVITAGFEDLLLLGRQNRPELYALRVEPREPLIAGAVGVRERMGPDGQEIEEIGNLHEVTSAVRALQPEAVAVCLLHAYANDEHERDVGHALRSALDVPVSLSSEVLPEFRELERAATTTVNAYVTPKMSDYLERLGEVETPGAPIEVMQSNGGVIGRSFASAQPVRTVLSGPAGGVVGAFAAARAAGFERVLTFDMGGTSTDVALCDDHIVQTSEGTVAGLPIRVPMVDLHTVGSGGGSIASRDAGGALRVGPLSAGADPGPACYGRGGTEPTVTDAHVVLGRIHPPSFLGGRMTLDTGAAHAAVGRLADALSQTVEDTAAGIVRVANAVMEKALRVISIERGHDPRDFALVSFGGAGGLHACELADALEVSTVIVPARCGVLSAEGMLQADVTRDYSRTVLVSSDGDLGELGVIWTGLEDDARAELGPDARLERSVDARYAGQSFELNVDASDPVAAFHEAHQQRYGYAQPDRTVELVTLRVVARIPREASLAGAGAEDSASRDALPAGFVRRDRIGSESVPGPLVVIEPHATTWVPDGWNARCHAGGALLLVRESS